ncbi:hypothetical protein [uncultured Nitratireductor sp.]|uniref:hypothetical protein n=1 Tax=uncultured Nitratireductor sp. TaxID=520953 RepID=UPI0025F5FA67|nr:hypothetical protein [uncultured Nitratireductor sp.]
MTRRIEALRIDTSSIHSNARSTQNSEAQRGDAARREQIDKVGLQANRTQESHTSQGANFQDLAPSAPPDRKRSPDELLADFVAPETPNVEVLERSVPILEHFVTEMVPELRGGKELHEMATTLLAEEIERHQYLLRRMQGGVEPD